MFTGVIHHIGKVTACNKQGDWRITIVSEIGVANLGDSIACNGCCLTVAEMAGNTLTFSLSPETLNCTAPRWEVGTKIHLERAMRLGDTLDGHLMSGHVDGLVTLVSVVTDKDSHVLTFEAPKELARFIAAKGSVALDGISLTVNKVKGKRFTVNIIPHTWDVTTFHERVPGDKLNLEIDLIARYVGRLLGK